MPVNKTIPITINTTPEANIVGITVTLNQKCSPATSITYTENSPEITLSQNSITLNSDFGTCSDIVGTMRIATSYDGTSCEGVIKFIPDFTPPPTGTLEVFSQATGLNIGTETWDSVDEGQRFPNRTVIYRNTGNNAIRIIDVTESDPDNVFTPTQVIVNRVLTPGQSITVTYRASFPSGEGGTKTATRTVNWEDTIAQVPRTTNYTLSASVRIPCDVETIELRIDQQGTTDSNNRTSWVEFVSSDAQEIISKPGGQFTRDVKLYYPVDETTPTTYNTASGAAGSSYIAKDDYRLKRVSSWTVGGIYQITEKIPGYNNYWRASSRIYNVREISPDNFVVDIIAGAQDHVQKFLQESGYRFDMTVRVGNTVRTGSGTTPVVDIAKFYGDFKRILTPPQIFNQGLYTEIKDFSVPATGYTQVSVIATLTRLSDGEVFEGETQSYFRIKCP